VHAAKVLLIKVLRKLVLLNVKLRNFKRPPPDFIFFTKSFSAKMSGFSPIDHYSFFTFPFCGRQEFFICIRNDFDECLKHNEEDEGNNVSFNLHNTPPC
jgi:hypothetical protein